MDLLSPQNTYCGFLRVHDKKPENLFLLHHVLKRFCNEFLVAPIPLHLQLVGRLYCPEPYVIGALMLRDIPAENSKAVYRCFRVKLQMLQNLLQSRNNILPCSLGFYVFCSSLLIAKLVDCINQVCSGSNIYSNKLCMPSSKLAQFRHELLQFVSLFFHTYTY